MDSTDYSGSFDKIFQLTGGFGRYQLSRFIILCIACAFPCAFWMVTQIFIIIPPAHKCAFPPTSDLPEALRNLSEAELSTLLTPITFNQMYHMDLPDQCKMRNPATVAGMMDLEAFVSNGSWMESLIASYPEEETISCQNGWNYYDPAGKWSIIAEWDLVCRRDYLGHLMLTIQSVGGIVGTLVFSMMQDIIGRKLVFFIAFTWFVITGCISALMPSAIAYIAMTTIRAVCGIALFQVPYILALEMVTHRLNTMIINLMSMVFAIASALAAVVAWYAYRWQTLVWVNSAGFAWLVFTWWLLDESPRWLLTKGRKEEALKIISKIARINRAPPLDLNQLETLFSAEADKPKLGGDKPEKSASLFSIFTNPNLAIIAFVLAFLWCANVMVYVGINQNSYVFGGNPYLVFILISLIEIPAEVFNFVVNYVGRIWPSGLTMALSGISLLIASGIPQNETGAIVFLAVFSKFCISASFCTLYQLGGELFPTCVRASGIGFATMISQVFSIVTPFIIYSAYYYRILPTIILGVLSILGGMLTFFLPETLNRRLPDSIADTKKYNGFGLKSFIGNITFASVKKARAVQRRETGLSEYGLK